MSPPLMTSIMSMPNFRLWHSSRDLLFLRASVSAFARHHAALLRLFTSAVALERLRADIYSSPSGSRNIADMAKTLSVSPSHFQYLYTSRFGVSCYEDILCARMKNAEYYLLSTDMTVKNIAAVCGYENDVHFMRQFKRRYNMTPSQFRQKNKK